MPSRLRSRDKFYAGETVTFWTQVLDDDDLPVKDQPADGVQLDVKSLDEATTHATDAMALKAEHTGTVTEVTSEGEAKRLDRQSIREDTAEWQPGEHSDRILLITSGDLNGQRFRIGDNTHDTVTLKEGESWGAGPAVGDTYTIHGSEYEASWESDPALAGQFVVGVITATDNGVPYKSIDKVKVLLQGTLE